MHIKVHAIMALLFGAVLCGCEQPQLGQPTDGAQQGGGYGPYGAPATPSNAPTQDSPFQTGGEGVVSGGSGNVPPQFQQLVIGYLDGYTEQMAQGWPQVPSVPDAVVGLDPNGEHRWQVRLRGGRSYAFIGACDNECSNLDLILEDGSGAQIDSDVLPDDYPLVEVTPPADGVYTLRIQLRACSIGPCYVAARLVARS